MHKIAFTTHIPPRMPSATHTPAEAMITGSTKVPKADAMRLTPVVMPTAVERTSVGNTSDG